MENVGLGRNELWVKHVLVNTARHKDTVLDEERDQRRKSLLVDVLSDSVVQISKSEGAISKLFESALQ